MSEGLKNQEEGEENEEEGDAINTGDPDRISINPPVRRESKKTKTQRNKEKRKKMQVGIESIKKNFRTSNSLDKTFVHFEFEKIKKN